MVGGGEDACLLFSQTGVWANTSAATSRFVGNAFTPSSDVSVCKVALDIYKSASETTDFVVELRADNSGRPAETVLTTSDTVSNSTVPSSSLGWVEFSFSPPLQTLSAGTTYWVVLKKSTIANNGYSMGLGMSNATLEAVYASSTGLNDSWTTAISTTRTMEMRVYGE